MTTLDGDQLAHLQSWVGRTQVQHEQLSVVPMRGLHALLDHPAPAPQWGDPVPPLGRWLYFLPQAAQSEIAQDGHPQKGGFLPPVPLPRRMWAGGRLQWHAGNPLRIGDEATLTSTIVSVDHKSGRSGELVFVVVRHTVSNDLGDCMVEDQDIVYRSAPVPGQPAPAPTQAPTDETFRRTFEPTAAALFRYSALTFNAHRIHYDRPYATEVEGYAGLVVHGPLIATLLVDLVQQNHPTAQILGFDFKAVRPTLDLQPFEVCARALDPESLSVWGRDASGYLTMQGTVRIGQP